MTNELMIEGLLEWNYLSDHVLSKVNTKEELLQVLTRIRDELSHTIEGIQNKPNLNISIVEEFPCSKYPDGKERVLK